MFVVVLTPDAVTSRWVRTETNAAVTLEHQDRLRFLPLDVAPCEPPLLWSGYQYVPFRGSYEVGLDALLRRLDAQTPNLPLPSPLPEGEGVRTPAPPPRERRVKEEQWRQLQAVAHEIAAELGRQSGDDELRGVYRQFNRHFGLTTYKKLPRKRFDEGLAFFTEWRDEVVASSTGMQTPLPNPLPQGEGAQSELPTGVTRLIHEKTGIELIRHPDELPSYKLLIHNPGHDDNIVPLTRPVISLGRNIDNDIVLPADSVSRYHARLQETTLAWELVDLGSINGTWVNDRRLPRPEEPTTLTIGDIIRIGHYKLIIQVAEVAATNNTVDRRTHSKSGIDLIRIPSGPFLYDNKREIMLPEYWIGRYPVTNAQYKRFLDATDHRTPSHWNNKVPPKEKLEHPVVHLSWDDAKLFCDWAGLVLPTEQQWEKAARGANGRTWPWGDESPTNKHCNFGRKVDDTTPVGSYSPLGDSPYGCADMAGNVWEWTESWYAKGQTRTLRGGSWLSSARDLRAAFRSTSYPDYWNGEIGFRIVELLSDPES